MSATTHVLFLKKYDENYASALLAAQKDTASCYTKKLVPCFTEVLTFEYLNQSQLCEILLHLSETHSGIILTSPRASTAIASAVETMTCTDKRVAIQNLQSIKIFAVGRATGKSLDAYGINCLGESAGSSENISAYLEQEGVLPPTCHEMPMLFLCGDKRQDTIPDSFRKRDLVLHELKVYQSVLKSRIELPPECKVPAWVVFFSPSGLKAVKDLPLPWDKVLKATIGNTTAAALREYAKTWGESHWEPNAISSAPNAQALASAIVDYEHLHL